MVAQSTFITLCLPLRDEYEICGTYGEATLAKFLDIPLFIVTARDNQDIPEWVVGCATAIFKSWDDYYNYISLHYIMVDLSG